jgi:hypothetical protein
MREALRGLAAFRRLYETDDYPREYGKSLGTSKENGGRAYAESRRNRGMPISGPPRERRRRLGRDGVSG